MSRPGSRSWGSSPLARGLHTKALKAAQERRIIPARAGFTDDEGGGADEVGDHPCSRGVYSRPSRRRAGQAGSSPLARGLLRRARCQDVCCGIIPARAEFTYAPPLLLRTPGDHPRSRGVYRDAVLKVVDAGVDHPRSRGVYHPDVKSSDLLRRIIPARAGFTDRARHQEAPHRDHPRSRGVYGGVEGGGDGVPGIIPARAGFTPPTTSRRPQRTDHPRSRGVYPGIIPGPPMVGGIIPARAGFTRHRRRTQSRPADHPRSRGVYLAAGAHCVTRNGSSPLARGLHIVPEGSFSCLRIIPARAGFTLQRRQMIRMFSDHPRSRGVYGVVNMYDNPTDGSSPLARGLRRGIGADRETYRIIPARAGFTLGGHPPHCGRRDHPRSRGVYVRGG